MDSQPNIYGFVNLGVENMTDSDGVQEAKNALVFLAVGINVYWKLPIGYFMMDWLMGRETANILEKAIELLTDTGVKLHFVTFYGTSVNITRANCLEADLNYNPYIINSRTNEPIYMILDNAHLIKLMRTSSSDTEHLMY